MSRFWKFVAHSPSIDPALDGFSNVTLWEGPDTIFAGDLAAISTRLQSFYNDPHAGMSQALAVYMPPSLDPGGNHSTITAYEATGHLDGTPMGPPVLFQTWSLDVASSLSGLQPCPDITSSCISYHSDFGSDVEFGTHVRPRARDRGRMYIPIGTAALGFDTTSRRTKLKDAYITDALNAGKHLTTDVTNGGNVFHWRQWSRKNATAKPITLLFMDNQPDVQRRRADPTPGSRVTLAP